SSHPGTGRNDTAAPLVGLAGGAAGRSIRGRIPALRHTKSALEIFRSRQIRVTTRHDLSPGVKLVGRGKGFTFLARARQQRTAARTTGCGPIITPQGGAQVVGFDWRACSNGALARQYRNGAG